MEPNFELIADKPRPIHQSLFAIFIDPTGARTLISISPLFANREGAVVYCLTEGNLIPKSVHP